MKINQFYEIIIRRGKESVNVKLKKIILYISLTPYIYLLISSLYYAICGYTYNYNGANTIYGIDAFLDNVINRFWFDNFVSFNFIGFLCICCVGYQIWYFINMKSTKGLNKKKLNIKKILLMISLLSWIIYFLSGIYAIFFGYERGFFYHITVYGFEAFKDAMFWNLIEFTFIPVLPITLIYIIIYFISKIMQGKTAEKNNKRLSVIMLALLFIIILIVITVVLFATMIYL
jgi:hypothetical protein